MSDLTPQELRVLGCLVEKGATTPDYYPLTLNALITACNQRSNRDPVVDYDDATVIRAIDGLRDRGWIRLVRSPGQRAVKYRHVLDDVLEVDDAEAAILAVLSLRGEQTPGELRARTDRYVEFDDLDEVEATLERLADRGLVHRLERRPGEKESRYVQMLAGSEAPPADERLPEESTPEAADDETASRIETLEARVEAIAADLAALRADLGAAPGPAD
ncbi:MAG: YceH family protein [Acidimicrobiia bacterium]|nr:YceH family protein [Acidimicrobiia bacterium]